MRLANGLLFLVVSLAFSLPLMAESQASSAKITWYTDYNKAAEVAKKENKPLLLFFTGSDWCGWCKKLDKEAFQSPEFAKQVGGTFVFVEVDFPMKEKLSEKVSTQNNELKKKYGISGFPTVIILDSKGNFMAETGYKAGGATSYANHLKGLLQ